MDAPLRENSLTTTPQFQRRLNKRYRSERRFRFFGRLAIGLALFFLATILASIFFKGHGAFTQTYIRLSVEFTPEIIDPEGKRDLQTLSSADYESLIKTSLRTLYPEVKKRRGKKRLYALVSSGAAFELREMVLNNPDLIGTRAQVWVSGDDDVDMLIKGHIDRNAPASDRRLNDDQLRWLDSLSKQGHIERRFNTTFFLAGDSREPELAGIRGALMGSILTLSITLLLSFPIGIGAAIYLEEFASRSRWTDLIEVNINNLAAVPSIVFGLLGLAVFLNFFELPRSASLVGALVLSLMTLPTVIISGRAALKSVPPSIREAALGIGASKMQMVTHHVLPLALPGMLTGTIIGMARALGETAPLLMIGMVAFIVDVPSTPLDPATALPVQIFLWADSPERAFVERTSAAIIVLLIFLVVMNATAVWLRRRFERRW